MDGSIVKPRMILGLAIMAVGVLMTLDNLGLFDFEQVLDPLATPGDGWHYRHTQVTGEPTMVNRPSVTSGLVDEVQCNNGTVCDFQHLEDQIQVAFEVVGIHDDDGHIRPRKKNEVTRNLLVYGRSQ